MMGTWGNLSDGESEGILNYRGSVHYHANVENFTLINFEVVLTDCIAVNNDTKTNNNHKQCSNVLQYSFNALPILIWKMVTTNM